MLCALQCSIVPLPKVFAYNMTALILWHFVRNLIKYDKKENAPSKRRGVVFYYTFLGKLDFFPKLCEQIQRFLVKVVEILGFHFFFRIKHFAVF